jgi:single-stranded-DNA-specific exonuclease
MSGKIWKIADNLSSAAAKLAEELRVSALIGQLLFNRGITEPQKAKIFLTPDLSQLYDPFLFRDMKPAVERICRAIDRNEQILVYGDYDVDGITSVALMIRVLAKYLPGKLLYYLPKRLEEGYGLNLNSLKKALSRGVDLIITVDCGISAIEEAVFLKTEGIDLIITDHHEPQEILPEACAIIDPKVQECGYPFSQLAGVGVAFKLLQGLAREIPEISAKLFQNLDLVAFGTVADIVPLLEENRVLVKYGLEQLQKTENIGLQALLQVSTLKEQEINCGHIGYILAPRINAAGRMGNPSICVKLFLSNDLIGALDLAKELDKINLARQEIESKVLLEAQAQIKATPGLLEEHALVLAGENWHLGVIGIVASKLVDLYHKPVILIGLDGDEGRGSGRSISGFNLFQAIDECSGFLVKFGGHEFAAGLTIAKDQISPFTKDFLKLARERLTWEDLQPIIKVEGLIDLSGATLDLARELSRMAPWGPSNPTPILGCRSLRLVDYKNVGENGKHLKLRVRDQNVVREGIGFNLGSFQQELASTREVDLAFSLEENNWNGSVQVQLNLKDVVARGSGT